MAASLCNSPIPHVSRHKCYHHKSSLESSFLSTEHVRALISRSKASSKGSNCNKTRSFHVAASLGGLLGNMFKGADTGESTRQQYGSIVNSINGLEAKMSALSDLELKEKTFELRKRAQQGQTLDSLLPVSQNS